MDWSVMIKLWLDDVRDPPEGWIWARTNEQAKAVFENGWPIAEISLDFDLGLHGVELPDDPDELITAIETLDSSAGNGADLVRWMLYNKYVPPKITIHSWNPDGARKMARLFHDAGYSVSIQPFKSETAI